MKDKKLLDADQSKLKRAYNRFVPQEFFKLLGEEDITKVKLGDQVERTMTVLFSDIRNFTSLSETMSPQKNFDFINSYLSQMEPVISKHGGIIDKYVGDAIMVLFPNGADDALKGSISMLSKLDSINQKLRKEGYGSIKIGIGLNTGLLMLGTVGGKNRMEGTVISDAVNLASRIEGMTKLYGVNLLISEYTYYNLKYIKKYYIRFIDRVFVKGKTQPQSVYEVFSADEISTREAKSKTIKIFEEALASYHLTGDG
ncbi:adenylate/guanylate cyclase domain-containing protein [Thermodesulfobacteriota bacterium]